jgi:hypothetical protein
MLGPAGGKNEEMALSECDGLRVWRDSLVIVIGPAVLTGCRRRIARPVQETQRLGDSDLRTDDGEIVNGKTKRNGNDSGAVGRHGPGFRSPSLLNLGGPMEQLAPSRQAV